MENIKNYKRVILLSLVCILVGLYFFINAVSIKPEFKATTFSLSKDYVDGSGIVTSSNKYKVISATVRVTVYDENDEIITSQFFEYTEKKSVLYNFRFTKFTPKKVTHEIYDLRVNNKNDIIISFFGVLFGLVIGIKTYLKTSIYNIREKL